MIYGNSWEKYPIEENEIWRYKENSISVQDITKGLPDYMYKADMIYTDAPWTLGNVNMFNKKAGRQKMNNYEEFYSHLFLHIKNISPKVCYLEIGKENLNLFISEMSKIFNYIDQWEIKYYNKYICYLIRGGNKCFAGKDLSKFDDTLTPEIAILNENIINVADLCMGRGITALACHKYNIKYVGTELIKRKLAVFIDKMAKNNIIYQKQ
jgi:predicted methyltransferase